MNETPRAHDPSGETGRANRHPVEASAAEHRAPRTPPNPVAEVAPAAFGLGSMHRASLPQPGGASPEAGSTPAPPGTSADPAANPPPTARLPDSPTRPSPAARATLALIRGYKAFVSPLLPPSCRFEPSCSAYGHEAIAKYGIIRGGRLAVWRILRCNPFGRGGYDPVP